MEVADRGLFEVTAAVDALWLVAVRDEALVRGHVAIPTSFDLGGFARHGSARADAERSGRCEDTRDCASAVPMRMRMVGLGGVDAVPLLELTEARVAPIAIRWDDSALPLCRTLRAGLGLVA